VGKGFPAPGKPAGDLTGQEAYMELAIAGTGLGIIGLLVVVLLVILILRAL
jgi:hypothetical protein